MQLTKHKPCSPSHPHFPRASPIVTYDWPFISRQTKLYWTCVCFQLFPKLPFDVLVLRFPLDMRYMLDRALKSRIFIYLLTSFGILGIVLLMQLLLLV